MEKALIVWDGPMQSVVQAQRALENQEQRKLQRKLDDIRMQIATLQDALRAETEAAAKQGTGNSFSVTLQKNAKVPSQAPASLP
jgi:hypothetical protein